MMRVRSGCSGQRRRHSLGLGAPAIEGSSSSDDKGTLTRHRINPAALQQISRAGDATAPRRKIGQELQQIGIDTLDQAYMKVKQTQGDMSADVTLLGRMSDKMLATLDRV